MARKYKCKLGYPDCKKGSIVQYYPGTFPEYFDEKSGKRYNVCDVENYTDFWEEIFDWNALLEEAKRKYPTNTVIYSKYKQSNVKTFYYPYKDISNDDYIKINTTGVTEIIYDINTKKWAEIIEPNIITEDSVKLYKGDRYWFVPTEELVIWSDKEIFTVYGDSTIIEENKNSFAKGVKVFSTKQAAETWVEENKPIELYVPNNSIIIAPPYTEYTIRINSKDSTYIDLISNDSIVYKKHCTVKKTNEMLKANTWKLKKAKPINKPNKIYTGTAKDLLKDGKFLSDVIDEGIDIIKNIFDDKA